MSIRFPQEAHLRDERRLLIRPFAEGDVSAVWEFFNRLPTPVRRYAWDNFERRETVERWARELDYDKEVPLVALDGDKVVGEARLTYRKGGPLRLVGRIQWLLEPDYRGAGLGTLFVNDFMTIARDSGLKHLTCMLFPDLDEAAMVTLQNLGFESFRIPRYGADPDGNQKDVVKMVIEL